MGKKRIRKTFTSKGIHSNVSKNTLAIARQGVSEVDKALNKMAAWRAGKNPWITVPGPSKKESMIRVRANSLYGDPRFAMANIFGKSE